VNAVSSAASFRHAGDRSAAPQTASLTRRLILAGSAGPVIFLVLSTVAGMLAPGYDFLTRTVSEAAIGPFGWIQTLNFFLLGVSIVAFALGLTRGMRHGSRLATLLLILAGVGTFANGIYPSDLVGGQQTEAGQIHNLLAVGVFVSMVVSYVFTARAMRREPGSGGYVVYTALTAPAVLGMIVLFIGFASDIGDPLHFMSGVIQRSMIVVAFGWITLTGRRLLRQEQ
jgi:Protein of unknown function (DUF998)